ncbi:MAG: ATP-binding protein [Clostridia bacterium]|nr:ATP-binding protein [Clostridia bacterium]
MLKKIFRGTCLISLAVLMAFFVTVIPVSVRFYANALVKELKLEADYLTHGIETVGTDYLVQTIEKGNRVTLISTDGAVIFDSTADADAMENHLDREEIREAIETGEGYATRRSHTLSDFNIYYAKRLPDGRILRVSAEAVSVTDLIATLTPVAIAVLALSLALAILLAYRMSKGISRELEKIDPEHPSEQGVYPELRPLIRRISKQNQLIARQMDELTLRRREFDSITENMDDGLIILDERAKIITVNKIAATLIGIDQSDADSFTLNNQFLTKLNAGKELRKIISDSLLGTRGEAFINTEEKTYHAIADPVIIDGSVAGVAILMLDETEKEKREELRREFTSNISHELKTPLTSISGFAELIRCGIAGDNSQHFADNIYREAQRLIVLVNDIIKLSRLDGKTPELHFDKLSLLRAAETVAERIKNVAELKNISIAVVGSDEEITADEKLLDEIIYNLCDNAVKYGNEGGYVKLTVGKTADNRVSLRVEDNGIGIPADQLDRVFERFYRVDKSHSKSIGGTGLGLSIVKHGIACHGGEIMLSSVFGKGTTVTAVFPTSLNTDLT